jgi:hypothetical protein
LPSKLDIIERVESVDEEEKEDSDEDDDRPTDNNVDATVGEEDEEQT